MGIKDFDISVSAHLPEVVALIPKDPAARLGRWTPTGHRYGGTPVQAAVDELGDLLAERLLGAMELAVDRLAVDIPPALVTEVATPSITHTGSFLGEMSSPRRDLSLLEQVHPGATNLVVHLVSELRHLAAVPEAAGDEEDIAAQHGSTHFALAVIVSTAVLRSLGSALAARTPAIVGTALGAAAIVLSTTPKPPAYDTAVLTKRRAEYLFPRASSQSVRVVDHRFWLTEGSTPDDVDFSDNGLVAVVDDGFVIRTGLATGHSRLFLQVLQEAPPSVDTEDWEEVVEISWAAPQGGACLPDEAGPLVTRSWQSPPWPGDYRVRVHAFGRDEAEDSYSLVIWQAPPAPPVVHKKTDSLGHRLRGEPDPMRPDPPDLAHRWIEKSGFAAAATITVVQGAHPDEVITALGGDPSQPVSIQALIERRPWLQLQVRPGDHLRWFAVLAVDGVVLAAEDNGYQGSDHATLTALSRTGKAASVYWNVNGNFHLAMADSGTLVYAGTPSRDQSPPNTTDLDFDGRHRVAQGLAALARFTGRTLTSADLDTIMASDTAYVQRS